MNATKLEASDSAPLDRSLTNLDSFDHTSNTLNEFCLLSIHLREHPFDTTAWKTFLARAEESENMENIQLAYEAILKQYPTIPSLQIAYISQFLNNDRVEELFRRFLKASPSIELLAFYLTYVRRIKSHRQLPKNDTVRKAYEFALGLVGQDSNSGDMWADYIHFLESWPAESAWEKQEKTNALRKVYIRAIHIPLVNLEDIWSDYTAFEMRHDRVAAKRFLSDASPAYTRAQVVLHELQERTHCLFLPRMLPLRTQPSDHYLPIPPSFIASERQHAGRWKAYLKWEESNPLMMEERDKASLQSRISLVYRKALVTMQFFPEIWFMAYSWVDSVGKHDEALSILRSGIEANPTSFVLNFTYIDSMESKKEYQEVHKTFKKFLDVLQKNLDVLQTIATDGTTNKDTNNYGLIPALEESTTLSGPPDNLELKERKKEYGLVWIMYMRFGRRAEGTKSCRAIFKKARKGKYVPWEIFEAAALMEYHCFGEKEVATRIFELGMGSYSEENEFISRYLGFLISVNDESSACALLEKVTVNLPPEQTRPLWECWSKHIYQYSHREVTLKLEKRMKEIFPSDPPIKRFAQRYRSFEIDAIASRDIGFAMQQKEHHAALQKGLTERASQDDKGANALDTPSKRKLPASAGSYRAGEPSYKRRRFGI
ncbi:mRNA 3'-end-processing protein rna14 [Stygiomarasmius scandens]|uniref:mRNA 3'-end-processing protein RNA14 n=1 Tax=Marasmiellus scandens TaxID=2682957 RepID=A0ABR1IWI3_9AGAR